MSGDELFEKLTKGKAKERKSLTIYFSRPLFEDFKALCEEKEVSVSRAIEQMVRDVLDSQRNPKESNEDKSPRSDRIANLLAAIAADPSLLSDFETIAELTAPNQKKPTSRKVR